MIRVIVFSKDRPFQCESLVRSLRDQATGIDEIVVVASATLPGAREGYVVLERESRCRLIFERSSCVRELPALFTDADFVGLAVDDQTFFRPSDYGLASRALVEDEAFLWSWRLSGKVGTTEDRGSWWRCTQGAPGPYGYLFHTDGSLYEKKALVRFLDRAIPTWRFSEYTPNDFEGRAVGYAIGRHVGPFEKTCVSFQLNKVTSAAAARAPWFSMPETQTEALVDAFLAGRRFDNETFYRVAPGWARETHVSATREAAEFYASLIR